MGKRDVVDIIPATKKLIDELCAKPFRRVDVRECGAHSGRTPQESVRIGFEKSVMCWVITLNESPIGAIGVVRNGALVNGTGIPWLLGTKELGLNSAVKRAWIKRSSEFLDLMFTVFSKLENMEDLRNKVSLRWLKWLGFTLDEPKPYGKRKLLFVRFSMDRGVL